MAVAARPPPARPAPPVSARRRLSLPARAPDPRTTPSCIPAPRRKRARGPYGQHRNGRRVHPLRAAMAEGTHRARLTGKGARRRSDSFRLNRYRLGGRRKAPPKLTGRDFFFFFRKGARRPAIGGRAVT